MPPSTAAALAAVAQAGPGSLDFPKRIADDVTIGLIASVSPDTPGYKVQKNACLNTTNL